MADSEIKLLREVLSHALPELRAWRAHQASVVREAPPDAKHLEYCLYLDQIIAMADRRLNPKRREEQGDG